MPERPALNLLDRAAECCPELVNRPVRHARRKPAEVVEHVLGSVVLARVAEERVALRRECREPQMARDVGPFRHLVRIGACGTSPGRWLPLSFDGVFLDAPLLGTRLHRGTAFERLRLCLHLLVEARTVFGAVPLHAGVVPGASGRKTPWPRRAGSLGFGVG